MFESQNRKITVSTADKSYYFRSKLDDIEKFISEHFYRCHQSYIVNFEQVKSYDKFEKYFIMKSGRLCYVSKRHSAETEKAYNDYKLHSSGGRK
jgi:two-component system response regulator AgrA